MPEQTVTEIQSTDPVLLIAIKKRSLTEDATRQLVDDVLTAAGQTPRVPIVLDMSQVKFAPSVALGSLVNLAKSFKLDQRRIALIHLDQRVIETIRVTQLHQVLETHNTLEQVLDALDDS